MAEPAGSAKVGGARNDALPVLSAFNLSKSFGSTRALDDVSLTLMPGRVHALLGVNGCGKSTLVKILAGVHRPDAGHVDWSDEGQSAIAFVHQDLGLIDSMTVAENLALASARGYPLKGGRIDWRRARSDARDTLREWKVEVDPDAPVGSYGPAEQTMIAVAQALGSLPERGGALVLDEPTARLPVAEADALVDRLMGLKDRAVAILYISHRLDEVLRLADDVTILRDGRVTFRGPAQMDRETLIQAVIGSDTAPPRARQRRVGDEVVLEVSHLSGMKLNDVSFRLRKGELLGVAGLVGSGRSELARTIFGRQSALSGSIHFGGRDITRDTIADRIAAGMGYVPQTRAEGLFLPSSVQDNIILADLASLMDGLRLSPQAARKESENWIRRMHVKAAGLDAVVATLSGGNQQKVALTKWMRRDLSLLILDEPTQGIDVGARTEIFRTIQRLADDEGTAVLVMDSDLGILADFCDRVMTMRNGRVMDVFEGDELSAAALERAVYGH